MDEQKLKAALEKEASQVNLPPDLLDRVQKSAEGPTWWSRLKVGAKLEIAAACLLLGALVAVFSMRPASAPGPVVEPPSPPAPSATCAEAPPAGGTRTGTVWVYFTCAEDPLPAAPRALPRPGSDLKAALEELLKGPTAEEQALGFTSYFSNRTAGMIRSVTETEGRAVIDFADFREAMPNASTSAGAGQLLRELRQTIFQFEEVYQAELRMNGSCEKFWTWLQSDCQVLVREGQPAPAVSEEAAVQAAKAADPRASAEGWAEWHVRLEEDRAILGQRQAMWLVEAKYKDGERVRSYVSATKYPPKVHQVDRSITREQAIQSGLHGVNAAAVTVKSAVLIDYEHGAVVQPAWRLELVSKADSRPAGSIVVDAFSAQVLTISSPPSGQ